MDEGKLRGRQNRDAICMRRLPQPQLPEDLSREMRGVAANDDAVVVGGIFLHFVQRRGRAAAALDHVRVGGSGAVVGGGERLAGDRRLVHRAAGEVGHLVWNLHPGRIATLMSGVGARDREAVAQADAHRVVVDDAAQPIRACAAEAAVPAGERHPHFHVDVRGCRRRERRRHATERRKRAECRNAAAAVVPETQACGVRRHSAGDIGNRTERTRECRRSSAAACRWIRGHDEPTGAHHLRQRDRRVRQRQRCQPLTRRRRSRRSLRDDRSRRAQ